MVFLFSTPLQGQVLSLQQEAFLKKNVQTIAYKRDFSDTKWKAVNAHFKNKRLILLGEFNHGSKEVFEVRTALVKHLHEELGIKTILFESGIGELILADLNKQQMTPAQMTNGLFGGWRTREFEDMMSYIQLKNISIAGFDVQRSGGSFATVLRDVAIGKNIDSLFYHQLEERYGLVMRELTNRKVVYDSVVHKTQGLILDYQVMHSKLRQYAADTSKMLQFSMATLQNRTTILAYMLAFAKDKDWNKRWAARDSAMAANIEWLCEMVYIDEPVVVIGHNYHIAKFNAEESTMGEILARKYGDKMYALGVFAGSGSFHDNAGKVQEMLSPDSTSLDIKQIISKLKGTVNFLNIPPTRKPGSRWLDQAITINDTFINLSQGNKMILSQYFDGLLFIDKVSPPIPH